MSKFNSGSYSYLRLPKFILLGLSQLIFLSTIDTHPSNSQSRSYLCKNHQGELATININSQGLERSIITWNNRQNLCPVVSDRFQAARDNGNLRFVVRDGTQICGTNRYGGDCMTVLFGADTEADARSLWNQLTNNRLIRSTLITHSNGKDYFNLEAYLETVPLNQPVSTNQ